MNERESQEQVHLIPPGTSVASRASEDAVRPVAGIAPTAQEPPSKVLTLPLKREYFEAIRDGLKPEEYRLRNDYWKRRLDGRSYDSIELTLGYPAAGDTARRLRRPWRGLTVKTITHPHFGPSPVEVYAINVGGSQ